MFMKSVLSIVFLAVILTLSMDSVASNCYEIKDHDRKNHCLAKVNDRPAKCQAIKDLDRRNLCLAEVNGNVSHCHAIKSNVSRQECLALIRR